MGKKPNNPDYGVLRGTPIYDRLQFQLKDDHIVTGTGSARREHYFMRLEPRNMGILSPQEQYIEFRSLQSVLDNDGVVPSFLSLDKTEGLDDLRQYYEDLTQRYPEYDAVNGCILQYLSGLESEESSIVERAHYMVVRCRNRNEFTQFDAVASTYIKYHLAERGELLVLLKNHLLRDYTPMELAEWDTDIRVKYEAATQRLAAKRRTRARLPDEEAFAATEVLRLLLPSRLRFDSRYVQQGDTLYRKTLRVRGWPSELPVAGTLQEIGATAGTTMRMFLEPISATQTNAMLTRQINYTTSSSLGARKASDRIQSGVEHEKLVDTYREQLYEQKKMHYVTVLVEVYGRTVDDLRVRTENMRTMLSARGMITDDMYYEQREGYLSMLPYGVNLSDTFKRNMPTNTISALYPFSASRKVDPEGLILGKTSAGSPFFWSPFYRDIRITNGVVLIAGNSGQGKSYLQKKILSQLIARKYSLFALDAENEYIDLFANMGCTNQNAAGGGVKINPFDVRRLADVLADLDEGLAADVDPDAFTGASALLQHLSWLAEFHKLLMPQLTPTQHTTLQVLVQRHYEQRGIDKSFDPTGVPATVYPTYSSLHAYVNAVYDNFDNGADDVKLFDKEDLRVILLALSVIAEGAQSAIFNGHTNVANSNAINFVVSALLNGDKQTRDAGLFNILTWIWNKVVTDKKRLAFAVDELYLYLNPVIVEYLRNFAKRARKYNAIIVMTTQNISDFEAPEIMHMCKPLFELALHKFLFYLGDVNRAAMKSLLALTDSELDIVAGSRQRHCLVKCGTEKYHLVVGTLPYEEALFGTAGGF